MGKPVFKPIKKEKKLSGSRNLRTFLMIGVIMIMIIGALLFYYIRDKADINARIEKTETSFPIDIYDIADYSGTTSVVLNDNIPFFNVDDARNGVFENYSSLDSLGRCGTAYANLSKDLMPTEEREEIGMIKPSGWHTVKYPGIIDDLYLYNRCHLIAYSLAGENANEKNLITGTRYFNIYGMLPYENAVRYYITDTGNHVLYRVTPLYKGNDLVAQGVIMEAYSVEDDGGGICFNVFVYNVQPGIVIDYSDGSSSIVEQDNNAELFYKFPKFEYQYEGRIVLKRNSLDYY